MHWVHFVLLRGVAKRARVNPFTIYCCRSLLQLPLMLQMWLPTCAIHSVWCFFFRWIKVLSLRTSYLWTMMNWTHISSTQLSSRYRNARAMPSTGRSSCCRTTQKKRRGGFFNEEKLLWLTLLLLNRCLLHTYLLHGLPFLQIIAAAAANNSDEFDCVCCFSITHNFFSSFLRFSAKLRQLMCGGGWWLGGYRIDRKHNISMAKNEPTATHSLRHTETRTDSSAEWWIIVTEWTNAKQSTPTSTLWANIIYFQHLIQKLLYWIIIP